VERGTYFHPSTLLLPELRANCARLCQTVPDPSKLCQTLPNSNNLSNPAQTLPPSLTQYCKCTCLSIWNCLNLDAFLVLDRPILKSNRHLHITSHHNIFEGAYEVRLHTTSLEFQPPSCFVLFVALLAQLGFIPSTV
jgi:hypothetical protein